MQDARKDLNKIFIFTNSNIRTYVLKGSCVRDFKG